MSEELKPCPFCGRRATSITDAENVRITGSHSAACPFRDVDVIVDSRDAWNTRAELAALKAGQGEAVAYVSEESFSSDGTSDIITRNLPIGTALYTDPPASGVNVPSELLAIALSHPGSADEMLSKIKASDELRALLAQSQKVKS